jgi:hypothetical protein
MTERSDIHKYSIVNIQFRFIRVGILQRGTKLFPSLRSEKVAPAGQQRRQQRLSKLLVSVFSTYFP